MYTSLQKINPKIVLYHGINEDRYEFTRIAIEIFKCYRTYRSSSPTETLSHFIMNDSDILPLLYKFFRNDQSNRGFAEVCGSFEHLDHLLYIVDAVVMLQYLQWFEERLPGLRSDMISLGSIACRFDISALVAMVRALTPINRHSKIEGDARYTLDIGKRDSILSIATIVGGAEIIARSFSPFSSRPIITFHDIDGPTRFLRNEPTDLSLACNKGALQAFWRGYAFALRQGTDGSREVRKLIQPVQLRNDTADGDDYNNIISDGDDDDDAIEEFPLREAPPRRSSIVETPVSSANGPRRTAMVSARGMALIEALRGQTEAMRRSLVKPAKK